MKRIFAILAGVLCTVAVANPQTSHPRQFDYTFNTAVDFAVATSPTRITVQTNPPANTTAFTGAVYLCYVEIRGAGQQVTLSDGNGGSFLFPGGATSLIGVSGTATTSMFLATSDSYCRFMPNGIYLSANASGVTATLIVKHN